MIAFLIDMYEEKCLRNVDGDMQQTTDEHLPEKVLQLCNRMATEYDSIREKYWQYVGEHFQVKLTKAQQKQQQTNNHQQYHNHNENNHQSYDHQRQQRDSTSATTMTTDDTSESRSSPV